MSTFIQRVIAGLLVAGIATAAASPQSVYKWVDKDGVTHYSESPPEQGAATRIDVPRERAGRARQAAAADADAAGEPAAATSVSALDRAVAEHEAKACQAARDDLALLASDALIVSSDDIDTATQLQGDAREDARRAAEARVKEFCYEK